MKPLSICAFLSLFASLAWAQGRPSKPEMNVNVPDFALNTKVYDFPTGLRIMMQSDRSHPVVSAWMLVNYGTKDDPEGKEETAHFVEHMWFRSKHGELPPVMTLIQDLGASFNATTRNDWTDYRTVTSSEYIDMLMRLESLRLTDFYRGVTEEEISTEREVIRNEWRRRSEQGYSLLFDFMYESIYPDWHGYHDHSNHESIDNIKLADLQAFVDEYYKPENTTIMFIGDFDPSEATSLIFENFAPELLHPDLTPEMYFNAPKPGIDNPDRNNPDHWLTGAWDPATFERDKRGRCDGCQPFQFSSRDQPRITEDRPPVPEVGTTEVKEEQAPVDNPLVVVGWSLPGGFRSDNANLALLGNFAGGAMQQGFFEDRDRRRIGDVGCIVSPEIENTTIGCYAEILDDDLDPLRVRDKMLDQLPQLWNPELLQFPQYRASFKRAQMESLAGILTSLDGFAAAFGGRAELIVPTAHYTNNPRAHSAQMNVTMQIDPATIQQLGYEYLKRERAATLILRPLPEEEIDIGSENSSYEGASATDQVVLASTDDLSKVTAEQVAESYVDHDLSKIRDIELDNGMRVVVLPHGEAPIVRASVVMGRDGTSEVPQLFQFVQRFTKSVGHDPLPIAAQPNYAISRYANGQTEGRPFWGSFAANDGMVWTYTAPSGNLDGALWLLREEVETARPYVDGKVSYMDAVERSIKRNWRTRTWHIDTVANNYLFPGHANGRELRWEDLEAMTSWGGSEVNDYLGRHLRPDNATLVLVGNIDGAKAEALANKYFASWKPRNGAGEPPPPPKPAPMPTEESRVVIFNDAGRTQTQTNASCRLNYTDPSQKEAVDLLSSLVRDRVFTQLRVKEGLAYSPGGFSAVFSDGSALLGFRSLAVNSGVRRTLEYFNEVLADVEAGNVDEEELVKHQLRRARTEGVGSQSMGQMSNKLIEVVREGRDWDWVTDRGAVIAKVSVDDLQSLVKGCSDHMITTLEGPVDILSPQLDEMGVEYDVYEWSAAGTELLWKHDPKAAKKRERKRARAAKKRARKKEKE